MELTEFDGGNGFTNGGTERNEDARRHAHLYGRCLSITAPTNKSPCVFVCSVPPW
jgi:hypothetical protein